VTPPDASPDPIRPRPEASTGGAGPVAATPDPAPMGAGRMATVLQMRDAIDRVQRVYRTPTGGRMFRYTMVSVITTFVSLGVLTLTYGAFHWSEVPATVFANCVATVPSYILNRRWAWRKSGRSHLWREIVPFWVASLAGIALSTVTASLARDFSQKHELHHLASTVVVDGANLMAFGILWVLKFIIFNRLFQHPAVEAEAEAELVEV
jgi:putative flippase GtrA